MKSKLDIIKDNWHNIIVNLKEEYGITTISFNELILRLEPVKFDNNILYIFFPIPDLLESIDRKYKICFKVIIGEKLDIPCDIVFTNKNFSEELEKKEENKDLIKDSNLISEFTFDTFIEGDNNALAYAAAQKVSESPGYIYNPFFIYGGPGLGKTHLMNAIAHKILKNDPSKRVLYVTSETFTNELIESIRSSNKLNKLFRDKYRNIDVLLIDDIQFIIGKESTQEEFFHTFNALHSANKQIVISSDKPPKELETLEERLKSRFQSGLTVDIQKPNYETRMAILKMHEDKNNTFFSYPILDYIASNIKSNIRELEGAFNTLSAMTSVYKGGKNFEDLTLEEAKSFLKDYIFANENEEITIDSIIDIVADHYKLNPDHIKGNSKKREVVFPRHVSIYLCLKLTDHTQTEIGNSFGGRDHSTISNARDKITHEINVNKSFENELNTIIKKINPKKSTN